MALQAGRMFAFSWNMDTDFITRSINCLEILGISREKIIESGQSFYAGIQPENHAQLQDLRNSLRPDCNSFQRGYKFTRPDGRNIWIEESGRGQFDSEGVLVRILGIAADVTHRHEMEMIRRESAARLVQWQEQDRARIARELHDDFGQRLAILSVTLDTLRLQDPAHLSVAKSKLDQAWHMVHELAVDLQRVTYDLHSGKVHHLGLSAALHSLCRDFSEQNPIALTFAGPPGRLPLKEQTELILYRISQEALRNIARHSEARSATVTLTDEPEIVRLVIFDDGKGLDPGQAEKSKGLGLISIRERVSMLGGKMEVRSSPGRGMTLEVIVPVESAPFNLPENGRVAI